MVHRCARVLVVGCRKPPTAVILQVGFYDGEGDCGLEVFDVADEVDAVREGTEETWSVVSVVGERSEV